MIDLRAEIRGFGATLRDGAVIWKLAPLIPLIAVAPEFAQHCAEISLGMFRSREAFRAASMDPLRMAFGGWKIAGLVLSMLVAARFWANVAAGARWWSMAGVAWKNLLIGFAVQVVLSLPGLLNLRLSQAAEIVMTGILSVAGLPGLVLLIGGILGDRESGLTDAYRRGWGKSLRIALYVIPVWVVLQPLHLWNHSVALGRPAGFVWLMMGWDAVVVGLIATLTGTALHHGYRRGR